MLTHKFTHLLIVLLDILASFNIELLKDINLSNMYNGNFEWILI